MDDGMAEQLQIRDTRQGGWFWMDNEIVMRDGKTLGAYGLAVYMTLCVLARDNNLTYTVRQIGDLCGVSRSAAWEALEQLIALGWVAKEPHEDEITHERTANTYRLLSKPKRARKAIPAHVGQNDEPDTPPEDQQPEPGEAPQPPAPAEEPPVTTVVNIHAVAGQRPAYDVYIGRKCKELPASEWGNPFKDGNALTSYREYLTQHRPDLLLKIPTLVGKRLGCWCKNTGETGKQCHGDILADLATQYQSGTWQPPDTSTLTALEAPALFTLEQIKAMKFKKGDWALLREQETKGRNRRSVIAHCDAKLAAHPLEPRFEEMMAAVDACTLQSRNDPGMAETFAKVIRSKLWTSQVKGDYYTPEELMEFSKTHAKVTSVHFLAGELSTWRQHAKGNSHGHSESADQSVSSGDAQEQFDNLLARLGRKERPKVYGGAVSEMSQPGDISGGDSRTA
jgi:DNA-binding MarR family transcriptional regulator